MRKIAYSDFVAEQIYHKRGRYGYDERSYEAGGKMKITCQKHGDFWQTSSNHSSRQAGCPNCSKEATGNRCRFGKADVVKKVKGINLPSQYSVVTYPDDIKGDITLRCELHNKVFSLPVKSVIHSGCIGCPTCRGEVDIEDTIADMFLLSKGRFKIFLPTKVGATKLSGWCAKHGEFEAEKYNLINGGWGCPICSGEEAGRKNHRNRGISIESAVIDLFYYLKGRYTILSKKKIEEDVVFELLCPLHGVFELSWKKAISKGGMMGCQGCGKIYGGKLAARTMEEDRKSRFLATAAKLNPQLQVTGIYIGVMENINVRCSAGHVTSIPAKRLLEGRSKARCSTCSGITGVSGPEQEISDFLTMFGIDHERNNRSILGGKELDIFIPSKNIALEYNGALWHSEKYQEDRNASNTKRKMCLSKGIQLLTVCSSIKAKSYLYLLAGVLGLDEERYFARKCSLVELDTDDTEAFELLNSVHVQGSVKGCRLIGLRYNSCVVAVMAFSLLSSERGVLKTDCRWELRRYASYGRVVGGGGKLLSHFIKTETSCKEVVSYSDNSLFSGGLYKKLGFELLKDSKPDYKYTRNGQYIFHKSLFKRGKLGKRVGFKFNPKHTERQNCWDNKWYRLWDCGKKKWVLSVK